MNLLELIETDAVAAMKSGDRMRLEVLRFLKAGLKNEKIAKGADLKEDDAIQVIRRQIKQLKDALSDFEKGGRQDIVEKTITEIDILQKYLPKDLTDEDIKKVIQQKIAEVGSGSSGKLMGAIMAELKGKTEGDRVRKLVEGLIK